MYCNFYFNFSGKFLTYDGDGGFNENEAGIFVVRLPNKPMTPQNSILSMTDSQILANFSTTPWTERSRFSKDVRSVFELAQDEQKLQTMYSQTSNSIRKWKYVGITGTGEQQWQLELESHSN